VIYYWVNCLEDDGGYYIPDNLSCYFEKDKYSQLLNLNQGDTIIIKGKCDFNVSWGTMSLLNCEFLKK
jgi:hypothetical protein